jgi:hypothetical protein
MESAMEVHAPHLLTEAMHVEAMIAVATAGGLSEEVFAEEVGEMRAELLSMGTEAVDVTRQYGERVMAGFEEMRAEQRAMEAKLLASNEMLKEEISKRADKQDAASAKMVEMLQQLIDRPAVGAGGAAGGAAGRMAAMEARQQLLEGATLVVQGQEEEGMRKLKDVSSLPGLSGELVREVSSMAAVARGAVEAKNGQETRAQEEYNKAVEISPGLAEELKGMGEGEVGRLLEEAKRVSEEAAKRVREEEKVKRKEEA